MDTPAHPRHPKARKRNAAQRVADLDFIAAALIRGRTIREIAADLSEARPYSLSPSQVHLDAREAQARWKQSATASIRETKARTLAALDAMEREAWEAWEKSRGPIIRETVSAPREGEGRARTTTVRETRPAGDPAFLRLVLDVCDRRARLMGVDMTGTAGGPAHDGEPPKLTVVVNQPKDERPWHEKVFAATGVKIDPRPEDLERTAPPAVGAMPA